MSLLQDIGLDKLEINFYEPSEFELMHCSCMPTCPASLSTGQIGCFCGCVYCDRHNKPELGILFLPDIHRRKNR